MESCDYPLHPQVDRTPDVTQSAGWPKRPCPLPPLRWTVAAYRCQVRVDLKYEALFFVMPGSFRAPRAGRA